MDIAQLSKFIFFLCSVPPRYTLPHTWFIRGLWGVEQLHFNTLSNVHDATDNTAKDCEAEDAADQQADRSCAACSALCTLVCDNCWST